MDAQLARLDAVALADLLRSGELSPSELLDDTIARIEALNPTLNAVIHTNFDRARQAAAGDLPDGPFRGVPWLLKDLWPGEAGQPFHMGVLGLKGADHRATVDANLTTAYKRAGFVICGRTNTPEMGLAATTEPLAHGPTRNPWDTDRGPGGSSGGAAAAVASGMVPAANASDGGGSIRIPAAMCGLVGLKPSRGRVSMGPLQDEWGNSVQHALTHTVRDSAAILDATAHPFPGDGVIAPTTGQPYADLVDGPTPRFRIGMLDRSTRPGIEIDPEVQVAVREAAARLERLGHDVDQDHPAALDDQSGAAGYGLLATASTAAALERLGGWIGRELTADDVEPATWLMAARGRQVTGAEVIAAEGQTMAFRRQVQQWWADGHDLLLAPTCLRAAPVLGEMQGTADDPMAGVNVTLAYSTLTAPFNTTGQPAISLPLARTTSGLPIGIQLVAAYGREDQLIQIAAQLERDVRWADSRSPMHP